MKIIWIVCERFDRNLDKATWIETMKRLLKKRHFVHLVIPSSGGRETFGLGKNLTYLPTMPWKGFFNLGFSATLFLYLTAVTLLDTPHIVLLGFKTFFPLIPFMVLSKLRLIKTKFVLDIRSVPVEVHDSTQRATNHLYQSVVSLANLFLDGVTVISPLMKKQICDKYSIDERNVGIWSSGVSLEIFNSEAIDSIDEPYLCNKGFVVMYHGTLGQSRGLQETVKAFSLLRTRYPHIVFVMLGAGKAKGELKSLIKELNLERNVFLHDPVPYETVPKYIARCDVGILPFPDLNWWRVSSPLKLMEYLAMGKSVIVTNIEAHREVLNNSPCGIFAKSHSFEEIAGAIERAYRRRHELREMGRMGRQIVIRKYTWDKQAENLTNFLKAL